MASEAGSGSKNHTVYKLRHGVTRHAWNADQTKCAVVHNDSRIHIYSNCTAPAAEWKVEHVLDQHNMLVSGLDWHPTTDLIVSCSHDRNAFVWNYDAGKKKWEYTLVVLTFPRGATDVHWSPNGEKFVVTSALKDFRVCTYDDANKWWTQMAETVKEEGKKKKKEKSTLFTAAWHPNNQMIALCSAKKACRVLSAYVEETGEEHVAEPFDAPTSFGLEMIHFDAVDGFVEGAAWSPDGHQLAFVAHDSTLSIATFASGSCSVQCVRVSCTPHTHVMFLSDDRIVAAGHSMNPSLFVKSSTGIWEFKSDYDKKEAKVKRSASSGIAAARSMFQARSALGSDSASSISQSIVTIHTTAISDLRPYVTESGVIKSFSTSCAGGNIVVWKA